ncbi:DUF3418 domain-containing protein, partial [Shigella flexneri]
LLDVFDFQHLCTIAMWINKLPPARREDEDVKEIRWMIEELRVSYFAQQLGTPYPISDKRILQAMEQISG